MSFFIQVKDSNIKSMFSKKSIPAEPLFSGHMQLVGVTYDENLEDTNSKEFQDLAAKLERDVSTKPLQNNGFFYFCICVF